MRKAGRVALAGALLALVMTQAAGQTVTGYTPVTDAQIEQPDPAEWLSWRRTLDSWGYSPLDEINRDTVGSLRMVWARPLPPGHQEGTALMHDGTIVFSGPADTIEAIDARSGNLIWQYKRQLPEDIGDYLPVYDTTRNVALYGNLVIGNSADDYVYALDARTGELVWETQVLDYRTGAKQSSGPIIAEGLAITGRSCEPEGGPAACVITAHDAATGKLVWSTPIIAQGDDPNDATWGGVPLEDRQQVGAWMLASYDPELGLIYMGTSVTAPAPKISLAGPDYTYLYHNSTLALDVKTGEIRWHYQHLVDEWDMDHTFPRMLVDQQAVPDPAQVAWMAPDLEPGRVYKTLTGVPGKTGVVYTLDRETGKFLWARPTVRQNLVASIDGTTGRVTMNPATVPTEYGRTYDICPSPVGGANYPAGSYSPLTTSLFLPMQATCGEMIALDPAAGDVGIYGMSNRIVIDPETDGMLGVLYALDTVTGQTRWVHRQRAGMQSVIATGGGLVFAGDADGRLKAFDQATGQVLWQMNLGSSITGYPSTFMLDGHQYLAVSTGRWLSDAFTPELTHGTQNTLFVFALPEAGIGAAGPERAMVAARGAAGFESPDLANANYARNASDGVFSPAQAQAGKLVYQQSCAACHGSNFAGSGGVPPVAGAAFTANWQGRSVGDLYAYTSEMMPVGAGHTLGAANYLAVTAYLLEANGYPAGTPLDGDEALLSAIGID
tara:strand:+ start:1567 stop:3735 length:2169 start_codon:yes stop_codon:yes gene_type:complete